MHITQSKVIVKKVPAPCHSGEASPEWQAAGMASKNGKQEWQAGMASRNVNPAGMLTRQEWQTRQVWQAAGMTTRKNVNPAGIVNTTTMLTRRSSKTVREVTRRNDRWQERQTTRMVKSGT